MKVHPKPKLYPKSDPHPSSGYEIMIPDVKKMRNNKERTRKKTKKGSLCVKQYVAKNNLQHNSIVHCIT